MSARTAIKALGRRVSDVRYVGRLARISAAVWRTPYTAATLQELKASVSQLTASQQEIAARQPATPDAVLGVKLDAIADGYGSALTGLESALRHQEQQTAGVRKEIDAKIGDAQQDVQRRFLALEAEMAALQANVAQLQEEKVRNEPTTTLLLAELAFLKEQNAVLHGAVAAITDKASHIDSSHDNLRARLDHVHSEVLADVASLRSEVEQGATAAKAAADAAAKAAADAATAQAVAAAAPQAELMSLKEQATALNNTVSSIAEKLGWVSVDNDNIRARLEFIRTEVMFELRKQMRLTNASAQSASDPDTAPRIINADKVGAAGPKRLNLGSGHIPKDGYINVDFRGLPGVDVVGDVTALDFQPGSIDTIFASHLIEHFPVKALHDVVLPHWRDLLRPGGEIVLIAPDGAAMLDAYKDGVFNFDELREVLYGGQEYEGDFHFNMLSPSSAEALLAELGFTSIRVDAAGRRNGNCLEFQIYAQKPLS